MAGGEVRRGDERPARGAVEVPVRHEFVRIPRQAQVARLERDVRRGCPVEKEVCARRPHELAPGRLEGGGAAGDRRIHRRVVGGVVERPRGGADLRAEFRALRRVRARGGGQEEIGGEEDREDRGDRSPRTVHPSPSGWTPASSAFRRRRGTRAPPTAPAKAATARGASIHGHASGVAPATGSTRTETGPDPAPEPSVTVIRTVPVHAASKANVRVRPSAVTDGEPGAAVRFATGSSTSATYGARSRVHGRPAMPACRGIASTVGESFTDVMRTTRACDARTPSRSSSQRTTSSSPEAFATGVTTRSGRLNSS